MEKGEINLIFNFCNSYRFDTRQQEMFHMVNFSPLVTLFDRVLLFINELLFFCKDLSFARVTFYF